MSSLTPTASTSFSPSSATPFATLYPNADVHTVDLVVVGGGGSGANAAVHFHDAGLSLLLVEKEDRLGGMVDSWTNPATGTVYDFGVAAYTNYTGTVEFFNRLDIAYTEYAASTETAYYADFTTGETVDYLAPNVTGEVRALEEFYNITSLYEDLFLPSYANWPTPEDIPDDLLMPFREFVIKYDLDDMILLMWAEIGAGLADMLDTPTLYVLQTFGPQTAAAFMGTDPEYVPVSGRNQDIYDAVADLLGESVLLNSMVVASIRRADGVELLVENRINGTYSVIVAKQLVMAIEPTATNMAAFDLDKQESDIFDVCTWSVVNTGIVSHPSLPHGMIYNLPGNASSAALSLPEPPFVDYFSYLGEDLWQVIVVGWLGITTDAAQELANSALHALSAAGTISATNGTNLTIRAWSDHGAMDMRTSADNVREGFIQRQTALQGHRSTYWTGAAFANQLSTYLWAYNLEYLVPLVLSN
ncbi:hypothetical protein ASPZODRAFT_105594 [Penicilliopsis zonata CBS 506.65]|uniref:monoamine oxidase n=1 Tax=Penicilliopsis zonata CBS 506.65 TaxID=1073090 RepID=A0A1L9S4Z7_9EURO|nr:hypothetical protein ASPZODRAFT_105594 [Penicilliopsis zonata CBS 506.65]OJJ42235.1 hypothetical protein ASPZODRAFT_105594 [Penicilliopsis zonata CBS 506.65]